MQPGRQLSLLRKTAAQRFHNLLVAITPQKTKDAIASNLRRLMAHKKFTQEALAAKSGVSQRMISGVLSRATGVSAETLDALAQPFGLPGWVLCIPDLDDAALRSGVATLVKGFTSASETGRSLLLAQAERELAISQGGN